MRYVYIARHGQSTWNAEGRWQGSADPPLSILGEEQAVATAERLREFGFTAVYSSALSRARLTAEIISREIDVPFRGTLAGFNERDVGALSGLTSLEIEAAYPGLLDAWRQGGIPVDPPRGEPWSSFVERIMNAFSRIEGERALLITHAGVLRAIADLLGEPPRSNPNLEGRWVTVSGDHSLGPGGPAELEDRLQE